MRRLLLSLAGLLMLPALLCTPGVPTDEPVPTLDITLLPTRGASETPTREATDPTAEATETPRPTVTATMTLSPTPTVTATPSIEPTPTMVAQPTVHPGLPNRFRNPGMLGSYTIGVEREFIGLLHAVADAWEPFYCDAPHIAGGCMAARRGSGNPDGLMMGRPEYKASLLNERCIKLNEWGTRVVTTPCQQWFLFYRAGFGGLQQTVDGLEPGMTCEAGAYVHSWSTHDAPLDTGAWDYSLQNTTDERANATWYILVNQEGSGRLLRGASNQGTPILTEGTIVSRGFGWADGIYDPPSTLISYQFTTTGEAVTVGFGDFRLWPFRNNDSYIDDAYLRCSK